MKLRIILLADGMHPFVLGGMQKHTYLLCRQLIEEGQKVKLLHAHGSNKPIDPKIYDELFPNNRQNLEIHSFLFPKTDSLPGHYVRENLKLSYLFYESLKDEIKDFDLVYGQGFTAYEFISQKIPIPVFINFHGYEMFQKAASLKTKIEHLVLRKTVKWMSRNADYVFSFGGQIGHILNELKVDQQKQIEFPLGISKEWYSGNTSRHNQLRTFVFLGRYERRKGIQELNESIKALLAEGFLFKFHFIGPIDSAKQVKDESIIYHGRIDDIEKIKEILKNSDVLVSPSYSEGMPTVILESMSQGLAIIGTDVGAVSKMVNHENGALIPSGDVSILKNTLVQFIQINERELSQMKQKSLDRFKDNFQAEDLIKKLLLIFKDKINLYHKIQESV